MVKKESYARLARISTNGAIRRLAKTGVLCIADFVRVRRLKRLSSILEKAYDEIYKETNVK